VKLLVAALYREEDLLQAARAKMAERFGPIDFEGAARPFDRTDYYEKEMGGGLLRKILSFETLIAPEAIVEAKLAANSIEDSLRGPAGRRTNLDVGCLDLHKVVLASCKYGPMKVHVARGIHADIVSRYSQGRFTPVDWTFEDWKQGLYDHDLMEIRARYRAALTRARPTEPGRAS